MNTYLIGLRHDDSTIKVQAEQGEPNDQGVTFTTEGKVVAFVPTNNLAYVTVEDPQPAQLHIHIGGTDVATAERIANLLASQLH